MGGDIMKEGDWIEREMWLSKNGSLVYWSPTEQRELVYYTSDDIAHATFRITAPSDSCKPWSFRVELLPMKGVEFAAGDFAAESENLRNRWLAELHKCS